MTEVVDIIEDWNILEADYMREYGINLPLFIDTITWRQFLVFLNGLSQESLTVQTITNRKTGKTAIRTNKRKEESILKEFF